MRLDKKQFLDMPFAVKGNQHATKAPEVDESSRTVNVVANTYYWMDSYGDVLIDGCCAKSISDRGPNSSMPGKIKHLANHDLTKGVGLPGLIEETQVEGLSVLRAESRMSETKDGEETLIKYKEGLIDQHSIGFNYMDLNWIDLESEEGEKMLAKLINPEEAEKWGGMWVVKEIRLFEFSSLDGFGANRLTPFLGVKSDNKTVQYNNLITKLDSLHSAMRSGGEKETLKLQEQQIKQMIYELYNPEPSIKDTPAEPSKVDTFDVGKAISNFKI
jgi:phage head maturation protease